MRSSLALLSVVVAFGCGGSSRTASDAGGLDSAIGDAGGSDGAAGDAGGDGGGSSDAGGSDGGSGDASSGGDGGSCGCIGSALEFGWTGGHSIYEDAESLEACRTYRLTRTNFGTSMTMSCSNEVPCNGDAVTIDDVLAALAHPDVVAAFAAAPVTYGRDMRPVDAPIYEVTQDGKTFLVGSPCDGGGSCVAIPSGVRALVDLLQSLSGERRAEEDCASVFPG